MLKWLDQFEPGFLLFVVVFSLMLLAGTLYACNPRPSYVQQAIWDIEAQGYVIVSFAEMKTCKALACETTSLLITTAEGNHQCFIDGNTPVCIPLTEGQLPR